MLFSNGCMTRYVTNEVVITDTIYVDKPYKEIVIKKVEIEVPKTVYIYKTDTVFREKLIRDTLITSIELDRKLARIHTITPLGMPLIKEYNLPQFRQIQIDHEGNLAIKPKKLRRKRFWRNVERVGIFIAGAFLGSKFNVAR